MIIITDGTTRATGAITAPHSPAIVNPTEVAILIPIGPGVD